MLGKVKKWLGIEGVKLEIILPESAEEKSGVVQGHVKFTSMHDQLVKKIKIIMIERYARGRRKQKKVDEYKMGEVEILQDVDVPKGAEISVPFEIEFDLVQSEMDALEDQNFMYGGLVKAAKWLKGAKSTYIIEAEADVHGVALNPFDKKEILLR